MQKRILIFVLSALMLTGVSWAQSAQAPATARKFQRGPARMFQQLDLTAEQHAKVQSILQSERSQMQALRSNASLTDEQRKQQVRELRQNDHQQLLAVLTPEQQARLKQLHSERKGRREGFRAGRRFQALNLTEQQKQQLQPVFQSTRQQMQALRSDSTLTPEQRRERMKEIRQNQMAQMKSILTPEQQQQLQQKRGRRMHRGGEKRSTPNGI